MEPQVDVTPLFGLVQNGVVDLAIGALPVLFAVFGIDRSIAVRTESFRQIAAFPYVAYCVIAKDNVYSWVI